MAKKAPVNRVSDKAAKDEREAIRKAIIETEGPTRAEISQTPPHGTSERPPRTPERRR